MKSGSFFAWMRRDHHQCKSEDRQDVSPMTVIRAYTVSCLLLSAVLMWSVGDAWCQYVQFCVNTSFGDAGFVDSMLSSFS